MDVPNILVKCITNLTHYLSTIFIIWPVVSIIHVHNAKSILFENWGAAKMESDGLIPDKNILISNRPPRKILPMHTFS